MRSREGRKQFFQEAFLTKFPISLQKLDNLSRTWLRVAAREMRGQAEVGKSGSSGISSGMPL